MVPELFEQEPRPVHEPSLIVPVLSGHEGSLAPSPPLVHDPSPIVPDDVTQEDSSRHDDFPIDESGTTAPPGGGPSNPKLVQAFLPLQLPSSISPALPGQAVSPSLTISKRKRQCKVGIVTSSSN